MAVPQIPVKWNLVFSDIEGAKVRR
jgi:hypothetical protein